MSEDKKVDTTASEQVSEQVPGGAADEVSEEVVGEAAENAAAEVKSGETDDVQAVKKAAKRRKRGITIGVICAIVIVAGAGFWVWHEQPSFCNAICHAPMDPTGETYEGVTGEPGLDKWGNYVEDMGTLMVVQHKEAADMACMDCHVPTIQEQVVEATHWVAGTYKYPLDERSLSELNAYHQYPDSATFCMNDRCHNMTRDDLARATGGTKYNPHVTPPNHDQMECSDCHKAHRQSVQACTRCHTTDEVDVPDGWLSAEQSADITSADFAW